MVSEKIKVRFIFRVFLSPGGGLGVGGRGLTCIGLISVPINLQIRNLNFYLSPEWTWRPAAPEPGGRF